LIEEKHELSIETSVTLAKQSLLAIADLHTVGKLHRDIKVSLIILS
jgi:serine/threonine protein kinase